MYGIRISVLVSDSVSNIINTKTSYSRSLEFIGLDVESEHFLSYFAQVHYNTYDKGYFPSKGSDFKAAYSLYTDNMAQYNEQAPFSALSASWASVIPATRRFSIIPSIYGRVLIGKGYSLSR